MSRRVGWLRTAARASLVALAALAAVQPRATSAIWAQEAPPDAAAVDVPAAGNPFGLMVDLPTTPQRMALARRMGVAYYRTYTDISLSTWDGTCAECAAAQAAGLQLVLSVYRSRDSHARVPSTPPADIADYQAQLRRLIETLHPAIVVVENEPDNAVYYVGSPEQYGAQLAAACAVAHDLGVQCADGGLLSPTILAMVLQHYLDTGQPDKAASFAQRSATTPEEAQQALSPRGAAGLRVRAERGRAFLRQFQAAGADAVNFHWYVADAGALGEAVTLLQEWTGLPAISNEIGQRTEDPAVTEALMAKVTEVQLPVAIWWSFDRSSRDANAGVVRALQDPAGALRATGLAFQRFIAARYLPAGAPG